MKKLYVGNIPWNCSEDDLKELFTQFGEVSFVRIITDRETGRSRGFGFVEMENGDKAISELDNTDFMSRALRVSEAKERESR